MEAHHDLRKFIAETPITQRCAVLSSGRGEWGPSRPGSRDGAVRHGTAGTAVPVTVAVRGAIDNVGRLTPSAEIETSTEMGSDQKAAEALQEAGTEVGADVVAGRERGAAAAVAGVSCRSADPSTDLGLTA